MSRKRFWIAAVLLVLLSGLPPARAGEKWAVIVGINDYGNNIPHLQYAVSDAKRLYGLMLKCTPADHVALLVTEGGGPAPTGAGIAQSVARLAKRAKPEDEFWFCFSGHGEDQNGAHYLLPCDANVSSYKTTAINLKDLRDSLALTCAAQHKLLVVDACHSGWDDLNDGRRGVGQGVTTLWASCGARESSWEIPELGEGVFTWFFLRKQAQIAPNALAIPKEDEAVAINTHVQNYIKFNRKPWTQTPQVIGSLPRGGLIVVDTPPDPPGPAVARDPLGPVILVDLVDARKQINGTTVKSDFAQSALRQALLRRNFPLVDREGAAQIEKMLDRKAAAAKAKKLGAAYLIRGRADTEATKLALTGNFVTVQATITAELIDESGHVLAQTVIGATEDDPLSSSDITETGAAKMALQEAAQKLTDALLPKLRALLAATPAGTE